MKILAIDPGNERSAFLLWDGHKIIDKGIWENEDIKCYVKSPSVDLLAIEMIASYGMPVGKTIFETCVWVGRFIESHLSIYPNPDYNRSIKMIYRKDIKIYFCNSMKAKDSNIRQVLIDRFGYPGTKKEQGLLYGVKKDIWSALAIAVYQYDIMSNKYNDKTESRNSN